MSLESDFNKATKELDRRIEKVRSYEAEILKKGRSIQNKVYTELLDKILSELDKDENGIIKNTLKNRTITNRLNKILSKDKLEDLTTYYINSIDNISASNNKQFSVYYKTKTDIDKAIKKRVYGGLGIAKNKIVEGSFLNSSISLEPLRRDLNIEFFKALNGNQSVSDLKNNVREIVKGSKGKNGVLENHLDTYATDSLNSVDSAISEMYSEDLGMDAFRYFGGLKNNTRDFCKHRNGKIITKKEASKWGTKDDDLGGYTNKSLGQFQGKNKGYNPLVDRGGYNCRHKLNYISNDLAVLLRDDLEIDENGKLNK